MSRKQKENITTLSQALGTEKTRYKIETQLGSFEVDLRPATLFEIDELRDVQERFGTTDTSGFATFVVEMCLARGQNLEEKHVRRVLKGHPSIESLFQILATGVVPQPGEDDPKNEVRPTGA